ncbi:hypothetical protein [Cryobacterium sp. M15]|uniref:hypothetical protein n=1 Tax=Cryobacterium sp. M15 TaxID=2048291 RepID=UPI001E5D3F63|nr:hypothetical protein [Cryobacterium sp. M15]
MGKRKFWFITLLVPIAIGIVIALVSLGNSTAASTINAQSDARLTFTYSDASGYVDPAVATALGGTIVTDDAAAIAAVKSGEEDAHFVYPADPAKTPTQVYGLIRVCSAMASTTVSPPRSSVSALRTRSGTPH